MAFHTVEHELRPQAKAAGSAAAFSFRRDDLWGERGDDIRSQALLFSAAS